VVRAAPGEQYRPVGTMVDPGGARHVRFERTHAGLPVLSGDFVVHTTATGRFVGATVAQQRVIDVSTTARVSRAEAVAAAGVSGASTARKVVDAFAGEPVLAWAVTTAGCVVIVDATSGSVRRAYDTDRHAAEPGTGHGCSRVTCR
jgi:Zn-dependent metalloprotease